MTEPLRVLIVEDEALLAMELEMLVEQSGHIPVGWATTSKEAFELAEKVDADVAFVDIHLADGVTGLDVAEYIKESKGATVVFLTANPKRVPPDFAGAVGVISKPYSVQGLQAALKYLEEGIRTPPPKRRRPSGFELAPNIKDRWP